MKVKELLGVLTRTDPDMEILIPSGAPDLYVSPLFVGRQYAAATMIEGRLLKGHFWAITSDKAADAMVLIIH